MKRLSILLMAGAFLVGALDAVALGVTKTKSGEQEHSWTTTGTEDCSRDDESDEGTSLLSVCFAEEAKIVYLFAVPRRARLRSFTIEYDESDGSGCIIVDARAVRVAPRRARVVFVHRGLGDGDPYACDIHLVSIRYRLPA